MANTEFNSTQDYVASEELLASVNVAIALKKPLLIKGEDSITSIAQMVGFSNPAYFGKVFHQVMRCSPSDYRKSFISKTQKV